MIPLLCVTTDRFPSGETPAPGAKLAALDPAARFVKVLERFLDFWHRTIHNTISKIIQNAAMLPITAPATIGLCELLLEEVFLAAALVVAVPFLGLRKFARSMLELGFCVVVAKVDGIGIGAEVMPVEKASLVITIFKPKLILT
jgi:hypothetical protein